LTLLLSLKWNQRLKLPGLATQTPPPLDTRCLAGQWHEQVENGFRWIFEIRGDKLQIWRTDHFVSGKFRREGSIW
jgi:hypothetical protein